MFDRSIAILLFVAAIVAAFFAWKDTPGFSVGLWIVSGVAFILGRLFLTKR